MVCIRCAAHMARRGQLAALARMYRGRRPVRLLGAWRVRTLRLAYCVFADAAVVTPEVPNVVTMEDALMSDAQRRLAAVRDVLECMLGRTLSLFWQCFGRYRCMCSFCCAMRNHIALRGGPPINGGDHKGFHFNSRLCGFEMGLKFCKTVPATHTDS